MELFGKDAIIGDFKLSDYGLMLASFENDGNSDDDLGMDNEITEEFLADNPVPVYMGTKFNSKLKPTITIVKNMYADGKDYFTEHECREVLRQLTGYSGYKTMQVNIDAPDELLFFNIHINSASYKKINGNVVGIILNGECDSQFAWSKDYKYSFNSVPGKTLVFHNTSDDLYHYLLPTVTIYSGNDIAELQIKNIAENNWTTIIKNIKAGEIITMDCKHETVSTNKGRLINNDFNMHFIRLIAGKNEFEINKAVRIEFNYKVPRKVGFMT